jgi:hypothetical protein
MGSVESPIPEKHGKTAFFRFATPNGVQLHKPFDAVAAAPL